VLSSIDAPGGEEAIAELLDSFGGDAIAQELRWPRSPSLSNLAVQMILRSFSSLLCSAHNLTDMQLPTKRTKAMPSPAATAPPPALSAAVSSCTFSGACVVDCAWDAVGSSVPPSASGVIDSTSKAPASIPMESSSSCKSSATKERPLSEESKADDPWPTLATST